MPLACWTNMLSFRLNIAKRCPYIIKITHFDTQPLFRLSGCTFIPPLLYHCGNRLRYPAPQLRIHRPGKKKSRYIFTDCRLGMLLGM